MTAILWGDHHLAHEASLIIRTLRDSLFKSAMFAFFYVAFEPTIRRRWPHVLIGWSRLVAGNVRDPLVGREILIGAAAGGLHSLLANASDWLPGRMGWRLPMAPHHDRIKTLTSFREALGTMVAGVEGAALFGFVLVVLLAGSMFVFRRRAVAVAVLFAVQVAGYTAAAHGNPFITAAGVMISALFTTVIVRFGLLAIVTTELVFELTFLMPVSLNFSSWAAPSLVTPILVAIALALFGFKTSLGDQPAFASVDD